MNSLFSRQRSPAPRGRHAAFLAPGVVILALGGALSVHGAHRLAGDAGAAPRQGADNRQVISLAPAQRDALLAEMRGMLNAMQLVMKGAVDMDVPHMRAAAQEAGMSAATHDRAILSQLPQDFRTHLAETHSAFDVMAESIRGFTARDTVLSHLSRLSQQCVACHAAYRLTAK